MLVFDHETFHGIRILLSNKIANPLLFQGTPGPRQRDWDAS
jgi:hypothetical protein